MGYQRSRQTSTVATLDGVPSSNGTSSRKAQTGNSSNEDKENANSSKRRYPCRSKTAVKDQSILGENGGSRSKSAKNPRRGKIIKCLSSNPGEDAKNRKRRCLQIRDGSVENHNVKTAEQDLSLADPVAVQCNVQDNGRTDENNDKRSRDEEGTFALHDTYNGRVAGFSNAVNRSTEDPVEDESSASVISKMQEIYSKLHLKYRRLKDLKFGEVEKYIEEQNRKQTAYAQAQQELLEHTRKENNLLKLHADQPNITMTLNRLKLLEQENIQLKSVLLDQHTKNIELKNDKRRLESLLSDHVDATNTIQNFPAICQSYKAHCLDTEGQVSISHDIHSKNQDDTSVLYPSQERELVCFKTIEATDKNTQVGPVKSSSCGHQVQKDALEGEATNMAVGTVSTLVKVLLQRIVGFKITVADEGESPKLVFLHQSSGYSFQLKFANHDNYLSEDGELAYQVITFGTLHKVIPDWMKDEIIFHITQVDLFFDRLLHVVNGRGYHLGLRR